MCWVHLDTQGRERMVTMNEEEKAQWQAERRARVDARRQEAGDKKAKLHKVGREAGRWGCCAGMQLALGARLPPA